MARSKRINPILVVPRKLYDKALNAVNAVRRLAGKSVLYELPAGVPQEDNACPLYYALKDLGVARVGCGGEIEGEIRTKDGVYDLGSDEYTGKVSIGSAKTEVAVEMSLPEIERLRDVADDFVSEFDERGEKYLEDRDER